MKEKNKGNPFVDLLDADEEILWFQVRPLEPIRPFRGLSAIFVLSGVLAAFYTASLIAHATGGVPVMGAFASCFVGSLAGMFSLFMPVAILRYMLPRSPSRTAYALTTARWLTYMDDQFTAIPLEAIRMLEFGRGAIVMLDLPDSLKKDHGGETLRQLVSRAREERLKVLAEAQPL